MNQIDARHFLLASATNLESGTETGAMIGTEIVTVDIGSDHRATREVDATEKGIAVAGIGPETIGTDGEAGEVEMIEIET